MADPLDIEQIKQRLKAATPGPWKADTGTRGDCVVFGPNGRFVGNLQAEPHWVDYPGETRSVAFDVDRRDCVFIAHSRGDIAALINEVERLRNVEVQLLKRRMHDSLAEAWDEGLAAATDIVIRPGGRHQVVVRAHPPENPYCSGGEQ